MQVPGGAVWIGSDHPFDLAEVYLNFRRDLVLAEVPASACFTLTADSRYRLWINGSYVARGPARCWPHAQVMDELDIAPHLRAGVNCIAVQVYGPGYSHFAHVHRAAVGWLGWIIADGALLARTDADWRVRRNLSWDPLVPRISIYGAGIERRVMALDADWQEAEPVGWAAPRVLAPAESPIWSGLQPRAVGGLDETLQPLTEPWQTRHGRSLPHDDAHQSLRRAFADCPVAGLPESLAAGETAIWVFDLGQSQVCIGLAEIDGARGGERLSISYAEKLRGGEVLLADPETYCRMRPTDDFVLRPGAQTVEPFSQRGGRYLIFRLDSPHDLALQIRFHARLSRALFDDHPLPPLGDPVLEAVAALCRRTLTACLQDGFVDSVWRESSQWLGDVVAQAFALRALTEDARPLVRAIRMAAEGALADGVLPSILPGEVHAYVVTDYNFSWIELLDMAQAGTDGPALVAEMLPTLARMLERFRRDVAMDGLLRTQPGRRLFLDWSAQGRDEPNLTYNLRYLHGVQVASRLADGLADPVAADWAARAEALQRAIRATHDRGQGWIESPGGPPAGQLALALLVLTGTAQGAEAGVLADAITARSLDLDDGTSTGKPALASPFMHHYLFQALAHLGRRDAIRAIIRARWGRWAMAGEATTWENWSIDFPDGSACHGFSAHPLGWLVD